MSDCCSSSGSSSFPSATTMAGMATNQSVIWSEIGLIQQAILAASSQCQPGGGQLSTVVAGNTPMTFITGVTSVGVTSGGSGYVTDTPTVSFTPPLGAVVTGASATFNTNGSTILSANILTAGSGYQPINATGVVSSVAGINAVIQPLVDANGAVAGINIVNPGTGYAVNDAVVFTRAVAANPLYTNAIANVSAVSNTGAILAFVVGVSGSGYQPSVTTVSVVSTLNPALPYPVGTGFYGTVNTDISGAITSINVVNGGAGYTTLYPYLTISDPGTGAATQVNLTAGSVSSVTVLDSGNNYTANATGTVYNPVTAPAPNPPASPAIVKINTAVNTFGTNPNQYYQVWAGTQTNAAIDSQINSVISYFTALGYTITPQTNPVTGTTLQWLVAW